LFIADLTGMGDYVIKEYKTAKAVLATEEHALALAPLLRVKDRMEVGAYGFNDETDALMSAIQNDTITITAMDADNNPFAMFGVGTTKGISYIWLLGSEGVKDNWYVFAKASKQILPHLLHEHPIVTNLVLKEYEESVRWLKWLGAKFLREIEINGCLFYEFIITKD